jgi:hypothetical protein
MKVLKCYIIILLTLHSIDSLAQPGYLGNKTSIAFQYEYTPYLSIQTNGYRGSTYLNDVIFVKGFNLSYGHVINRRTEFIARWGVRFRDYLSLTFENSYPSSRYISMVDDSYRVNEFNFDIGFRRYFKGYVAPLGWYTQINLGMVSARYVDNKKYLQTREVISSPYSFALYQSPITIDKLRTTRLSFGLGFKKMLGKKLFMMSEIDVNMILQEPNSAFGRNGSGLVSAGSYQRYSFSQNFSLFKRQNLYIGIGILLK